MKPAKTFVFIKSFALKMMQDLFQGCCIFYNIVDDHICSSAHDNGEAYLSDLYELAIHDDFSRQRCSELQSIEIATIGVVVSNADGTHAAGFKHPNLTLSMCE